MKKLLSLALALLMLLGILASCKKEVPQEDNSESESDTQQTVTEPYVLDIIKDGKTNFKIIYPEDASDTVIKAATTLSNTIYTKFGVDITALKDGDVEASADAFEILVGRTDREESEIAFSAVIGNNDYFVGVIGNKLVIAGRGDDSITNAAYYLMNTYIAKLPEECFTSKNLSYSEENNYSYVAKYPFSNLQILGESVANYKIVVPSDTKNMYTLFANELSFFFNAMTGRSMEVITDDKATGQREIWVGKMKDSTTSVGEYEYAVTVKDDCIEFVADSVFAMNQMLADAKTLLSGNAVSAADKKNCGEIKRVDVSALDTAKESPAFNKLGDYRIMYHNIWGWDSGVDKPVSQRNQFLYDTYVEYAPDILCLQEVTAQMRNDKTFPLIDMLCQSGYAEAKGEQTTATPILYRTDAYALVANGVYKFTGAGSGDDKYVTWAVLETLDDNGQKTGTTVGVLSVHLAYQTNSAGGNEYRKAQVPYVLDIANKVMAEYSCPVILGGDFNCTISSEPFKLFLDGGCKDVFDEFQKDADGKNPSCDNYKTHYAYPKFNKDTGMLEKSVKVPSDTYASAIDHVLFKGEDSLEFKCFRILAKDFDYVMRGSDHSPILIDFNVSPMSVEDYTDAEYSKNY